jgi:hypothetical protein
MIAAPTLATAAIVAGAVAIAVGLESHGGAPQPARPAPAAIGTPARVGLDATSDAEARRLRRVTRGVGAELSTAAECTAARCMVPALRHAGIGGRTTAMLARGVMAGVPTGRCRDYLFGLQAANDAASDSAHWLLPKLYEPGRGEREVAEQLGVAGRMLLHAAHAAPADVCSPSANGPPS